MTDEGDGGALDCFVSYTEDGRPWAEWITGTLQDAGLRVRFASWDLIPGMHRVAWLDQATRQARHTIAVVSDGYLESPSAVAEWGAAWSPRLADGERRLLVARVTDRPVPGLLGQLVPINLVDRGRLAAQTALLAAVRGDSARVEGSAPGPGRFESPGRSAMPGGSAYPGGPVFPPELPAVWNVPQTPARFVGRAEELGRLDAAMAASPLVALTGIAGIGKSSLAAAYVHRHRADLDAVWWVPGGRPELVGERVRALAPALGLPERAEPQAVLARLGQADGRWLIVLDDAADTAAVPDWLRPAGTGRLLVTSRNPDWERFGPAVPIGPLERAEAIALLADRLPTVDRTVAGGIAARLGDHPLALDGAAHHIRVDRISAQDYLGLLRDRPEILLPEGRVPWRPGDSVASLWDEPIRRLDAETPAAGELLRFAAHGGDAPFPIRLTRVDAELIPGAQLREAAEHPLGLHRTVAALERSGLAHRDGDAVVMHALVRSAVRAHTTPEQADRLVDATGRMLRAALPEQITANPDAWPAWSDHLPHALAVLDATSADADTPHTAWLAEHTAAYLLEQGHPDQATPLADRASAARERLDGPDHPDTLAARETHIRATLATGRVEDAGPLAAANANDRARVLGPDHPDTLASLDTVAQAYQQAGHSDAAINLFEHTLATRTHLYGPDHPDTLTSRHHLGRAYDAAGRSDEAAHLLSRTLIDRQRILGTEHPAALDTGHQLAVTYQRAGATGDASALAEQTLIARDRVLGPDHPDTLETRHQMALTYDQDGRFDDAAREFDEALSGRTRVLGPEHPATLDSTHGLARAHFLAGRPEQAVPLFDRALAGRERVLGPDHPDTILTRVRTADAHLVLGRPAEAARHLERILDRHERILGPEDPVTVGAREDLIGAYRHTGRVEAARPQLERLHADHGRMHGNGDARTLRTADDLAAVYRQTGRLPQAVELTERTHLIRTQVLGAHHPDTRANRDTLADTYRQAGRAADAVPLYRDMLNDTMRESGPFHADTTRARRALTDAIGQTRHDRPAATERPAPTEPLFDHLR
ncbi:toll/interleukin-1 receptor domain-containing protein [Frankia sp. QA3]|uniref:tetratricopeptide repeat protein n=1 Tax=Frankia sp. QA3 TaxID=710111 RepID=UPI000269C714|nr:toll/interleukin-1 receptor domain-containing protein [Frankia sp. QA3]EIV94490.1 TPR repeat-containing protein [Frankia sp. QA3]